MSERDVIVTWMRMAPLNGPAETVYADAIEQGKHYEGFSAGNVVPPHSLVQAYADAMKLAAFDSEITLRKNEAALRRSEAEVRRMTIVARAGWESARTLAIAGLHRATERAADEALDLLDAEAL